ncbi:MAG: hypothetical protein GY936_19335 [Ignavibacteriae bacterium]|nr:hypothetical protein [Ignavibacteriota bacterium]
MKLSKTTLKMLMNFREINPHLYIPTGSEILTGGLSKAIASRINIEEEFDQEVSIYDLGQFLSSLNSFQDPDIFLHEKYLDIKEEKYTQRLRYASKEIVRSVKSFIDFTEDMYSFTFPLYGIDVKRIQKAAASNKSTEIVIENDKIVIGEIDTVTESWNPVANKFIIEVDELKEISPECFIILPVMNFKILPIDYNVGVIYNSGMDGSKKLHFQSVDPEYDIEYIISLRYESWMKE